MTQYIVIKKAYFDNIKTTIDAINEFFSSQFKTKNFPSIESDTDIDVTIANIVELLNHVEPSWIDNPEKVEAAVASINETLEQDEFTNFDEYPIADRIFAFIGFRVLQFISENFDAFSSLLNGIYTFDLFMNPETYESVIKKFSQPVDLSEITLPDSDETKITLFDIETYVNGLFSNKEYINMASLNKDEEIDRVKQFIKADPADTEIVVDDRSEEDPNSVTESFHMEQAEVNYFINDKPKHIKYDSKKDEFVISQQLRECAKEIIQGLEKCDNTDDLKEFFGENGMFKSKSKIKILADNMSPFILNKVFDNPKKYAGDVSDLEFLKYYIDSYKSIKSKNKGAERYYNYDIFSTFKVDKEGTIQFLRQFLTCELFNNSETLVANNTLLTIFNIFDSRIYYDRLYNLIPEGVKKDKYPTEDGFVKKIRSRINKKSHAAQVYINDKEDSKDLKNGKEVQEFVYTTMKQLKDISLTDINTVEMFSEMVNAEISNIGNLMYNSGISQVAMGRVFQEMEMGNIPDYMRDRLNISDKGSEDISVSKAEVPTTPQNDIPIPDNSFDDLATSIDNKINSFDGGDIDDMLGTGFEERKEPSDGKIVYNVTNNYHYDHSFNKNSDNTMNDSSQGKTVNITNTNSNNDSSNTNVHTEPKEDKPKKVDINIDMDDKKPTPNNSNNNSEQVEDTITPKKEEPKKSDEPEISKAEDIHTGFDDNVEQPDHLEDDIRYNDSLSYDSDNEVEVEPEESSNDEENDIEDEENKFSNGMSVNEFFSFLEVAEPLSDSMGTVSTNQKAEMPEEDPATHILDVDRKKKKKRDQMRNKMTASVQPIKRAKRELKKAVDSLVKKDENAVKNEILENHDYRHHLQKLARFAIKTGAIAIAYTINMYVGTAVLTGVVAREIDKKERLSKEVQAEFASELEIIDSKIAKADAVIAANQYTGGNKAELDEAYRAKWQLMRLKSKMEHMMTDNGTHTGLVKTSKQTY